MKRMGFYVNCLSAEIHTDPFFHGAGGVLGVATVRRAVCVCVCVLCLCINAYLFGLLSQICGKTGMHTYLYTCLS